MFKKISAVLVGLLLVKSFVTAMPKIEFTMDYNCLTECKSSIAFTGSNVFSTFYDEVVSKNIRSPAGLGASTSIFLGSPAKNLDLGIGTSVNYNAFSDCTMDGKKVKTDNGYIVSFALGPAVRYTIGHHTSIYFSPGVRFNIQNIKTKPSFGGNLNYKEKNLMVNMSAGIREWLFATGKTNIGLDAGVDVAFPVNSFNTINYKANDGTTLDSSYKVKNGRFVKFYIGMCLNFGNPVSE